MLELTRNRPLIRLWCPRPKLNMDDFSVLDSSFVAFCSFFPCSLTVFHKGRQQKSGGRQQKSSRAGQQNNFFIFQPDFKEEIAPKNATKHPVA